MKSGTESGNQKRVRRPKNRQEGRDLSQTEDNQAKEQAFQRLRYPTLAHSRETRIGQQISAQDPSHSVSERQQRLSRPQDRSEAAKTVGAFLWKPV